VDQNGVSPTIIEKAKRTYQGGEERDLERRKKSGPRTKEKRK